LFPLALLLPAAYCGDRLPGDCCQSDDDCVLGLACAGRRATCDVRLVFQNAKVSRVDLAPFGMSNRAWSISGRYLLAGSGETVESFTAATRSQVRRMLARYLRGARIDPGDLVVLDMEPGPAYLPLIWQLPADVQDQVIEAYKLRIRVARQLLPHARLGLWGVVVPIATANEASMDTRMAGYRRGQELGLYDDVDYLIPVLYPWFSPGGTEAEFEARVGLATRQGIERSLELGRSDGRRGPPLAPMLTFWGRVLGTAPPGGRAESRVLDPATLSLQVGIAQEYGGVDVIGIWAPDETPETCLRSTWRASCRTSRRYRRRRAHAPSPACRPPCRGVAVGPFELPDPPDFTPDRRPVKVINLFGGHWDHNVSGNVPWWVDEVLAAPRFVECHAANWLDDGCLPERGAARCRFTDAFAHNGLPDPIDELLRRLDEEYAAGWRRIVLNRPAGQYQGVDDVFSPSREILPASQFWPMPKWKREGVKRHLRSWVDAHRSTLPADDVSVGIYVGFRITEPCELSSLGRRVPDPTRRADMCVVHQNLQPWLQAGIREVWFDASARSLATDPPAPLAPQSLLQLAQSPDYRERVRIGGEAIPAVVMDGKENPDPDRIARAPFMALQRFYESNPCPRPSGAVCRPGKDWTVPMTSEVGVGFQRDPTLTFEIVEGYVSRGFVPWAWTEPGAAPEIDEWIRAACGGFSVPCLPGTP
jgi:hypothetical protein